MSYLTYVLPRSPSYAALRTAAMSKTAFKIVVTHPEVPEEALTLLGQNCNVVVCNSLPSQRKEILEKVRGADGIFWGTHDKFDAEVLKAAGSQLKSVSTMSAGLDHVDIELLKKHKIPLGHTPTVLNNAVADIAIGLMIAAARRFHEGRKKIENSTWENFHIEWMWGQEIRGATVGFYGFGGIGQAIAKRLKGFDIERVLYTTRNQVQPEIEEDLCASHVPFNELLLNSDFIFIAAPLTNETAGIFNASAFGKMKCSAVLINIARGGLVNQPDLYQALSKKTIFAAGLDVMTPEPLPAKDPLMTLPNLVLVPHLGSATAQTRTDMAVIAAHNVLRGIAGEPMLSPAYVL